MSTRTWCLVFALGAGVAGGCAGPAPVAPSKTAEAPAKVQNGGVKEGDLATITLTPQAEQRLGIETAAVSKGRIPRQRTFAGEIVIPPGRVRTVASPVAGTLSADGEIPQPGARVEKGRVLFRVLPLVAPQRDLRVTTETELAGAKARLEAARQRLARADQMLRDQVGSVRAQEEASNELRQAEVAYEGVRARLERLEQAPLDADVSLPAAAPSGGTLRQLFTAPGQKVAAGTPLFELVDYSVLWLRVPVYVGEAGELDTKSTARLPEGAGGNGEARSFPPVAAPPTADPASETVDLYYEVQSAGGVFRPGERLYVTLAYRSGEEALQIPRAAVLYDFNGGAWVYENTAPHAFTRRRVDIRRVQGGTALLERGVAAGARVVTTGAAELFGTEFGAGK